MTMRELIEFIREQNIASQLLGVRVGVPMLPSDVFRTLALWAHPDEEPDMAYSNVRPNLYHKQLTDSITAHALFARAQTWIVLSSDIMGEVHEFVEYLSDNPKLFPPMIDIILHNPELRHYDCNLRKNY